MAHVDQAKDHLEPLVSWWVSAVEMFKNLIVFIQIIEGMTAKEIMDVIYSEDPGWNEPWDMTCEDEERVAILSFEIKHTGYTETLRFYLNNSHNNKVIIIIIMVILIKPVQGIGLSWQ